MVLASSKTSNDEQTTEETRLEKSAETLSPEERTDPRPLPVTHDRHLDVNKVLERSLPRLSGEA